MNGPLILRLRMAWRTSTLRRVGLLLVLLIIGGCAGSSLSGLKLGNPFHRQASLDEARYGPTPAERAEELRELANRAKKMPSAQQQVVSQQLAAQLRDQPDPILRRDLVRTLSMLATPAALSGLHTAMEDADSDVRSAACEGWGRVGGPEAVRALADALRRDRDIDVRLAAARSLSSFQDPDALRALSEALGESDPALKRRARISLAHATGEDFGNNDAAWHQYVQNRAGSVGPGRARPEQAVAQRPDGAVPRQ